MNTTDEVISRIKKAIRLANKTTEQGEKETAMRLAKSLADKNGISLDSIEVGENRSDAVQVDDPDAHWFDGSEIGHICYILREHFGVVVMMNQYPNRKMRITWFGSRLNIDIAKHVFHILRRESAKAWEETRKVLVMNHEERMKKLNGGFLPILPLSYRRKYDRAAFMRGFFFSISKKLTENPLRNDLDEDKRAAERKFLEFKDGHNVKEKKGRQSKGDAESIIQGLNAGNKVNLARPCEGRESAVKMIA